MLLVLDQAQADLGGPELRCPDCPGRLRRWGFARTRSLRCSGGGRVWLRPRRVRCASCRVTHVLLPALAPPHRAYTIDVVGQRVPCQLCLARAALILSYAACGYVHRTAAAGGCGQARRRSVRLAGLCASQRLTVVLCATSTTHSRTTSGSG